jgi:putative DNA methylase
MENHEMPDVRLIERWLPIAALSEESVRERRSMTALPPVYYLHVWWARRPLVASRAAILASLLPATADQDKFLRVLGIHGDPVASRHRIDRARRNGERFGGEAYTYKRAFTYGPSRSEQRWLSDTAKSTTLTILDPTAGGGSIPFEGARLGLKIWANDINPVAGCILKATIEFPKTFGAELADEFRTLAADFVQLREKKIAPLFPKEPGLNAIPTNYLWARTIACPYCSGKIPLSPNWRLNNLGVGIRLKPQLLDGPGSPGRNCRFEIIFDADEHSTGTVSGGDATCPYSDCTRVIDGDEVKRQAQAGAMGDQLYAIVGKRRIETRTKAGKIGRPKWEHYYRAPGPDDNIDDELWNLREQLLPDWEALGVVPNEPVTAGSKTDEPLRYGMYYWRDMFSCRQFLGHSYSSQIYREMVEQDRVSGKLNDLRRASYIYLSFVLDKYYNYNSRMSIWMPTREVVANTFNRHDFAFCWSYAEMSIAINGIGYDWAVEQTAKCIEELVELSDGLDQSGSLFASPTSNQQEIKISVKSGASLDHIADGSVDAVVMDPPYGANVMYAELSDFFYVWLKRTAGLVAPELFTRHLTDKQSEAVANKSHFKGQKGADALANRDYQEKMAAIFAECRRVLKPNGIMTVMFTHKDTGAWDALAKGLIEAGFIITASWPVNTEAEGSLHIKDKAAANSTIFLVCRPRPADQGDETTYWEDIEPLVAKAVRTRVDEFQKAGIGGVDLYLASFGPALEEFSRHWPLKRGTPRPEPLAKKRRKQAELFEEEFDPYSVTPEDALDAARREVKTWRLDQLTLTKGRGELDATTSWFVLAWDAFKAPVFSYDEGLRLARAVGADLEGQLIGRLCEKKGSDIKLWDSVTRAAKGGLGPADGSRAMIDAIHHAANRGRTRTLDAALDLIKADGLENDPQFLASFEAVLEVLPPSRSFVGFDVATGEAKSAADDFDALEKLRRLAFSEKVDEPRQLSLFTEDAA